MRKEYTDEEVLSYGYKYLNKNVKCPVCGRTMITYQSEDIAGCYFCFYDDCECDGWVTELSLARGGDWPLPKDGYKLAFRDIIGIIKDSNKEETGVKYIITFPDYDGLTSGGDTIEETTKMAREALEMYLEVKATDKSNVSADNK